MLPPRDPTLTGLTLKEKQEKLKVHPATFHLQENPATLPLAAGGGAIQIADAAVWMPAVRCPLRRKEQNLYQAILVACLRAPVVPIVGCILTANMLRYI